MSTSGGATTSRKVGIPLTIGLIVCPPVFAWFLLDKSYPRAARVLGFGWFAILVLWIVVQANKTPYSATGPVTPNVTASADKPAETAPASNWTYSSSTDEMRGTKSGSASVNSTNELQFDFPYSGGSSASVIFFRSRSGGLEDNLKIEKGQFLCHSFSNSHVRVKLDNGPITSYRCLSSSDGDSTIVFVEPAAKFLAGVKRAKKMVIEAEFYRAGEQQMKFDVAGLDTGKF